MWLVHWGTEEWWISRCTSVGHLGSVTQRPPPVLLGKKRWEDETSGEVSLLSGTQLRFNLEKEQFTLWSAALSTVAAPAASLCGSEVMCFIQELWVSLFQRNIDRYLTSTYISSASCRALWQIGLQANWIRGAKWGSGQRAPSSKTSSSFPCHYSTSIFFYQIQPSILTSTHRPVQANNVLSVI